MWHGDVYLHSSLSLSQASLKYPDNLQLRDHFNQPTLNKQGNLF